MRRPSSAAEGSGVLPSVPVSLQEEHQERGERPETTRESWTRRNPLSDNALKRCSD